MPLKKFTHEIPEKDRGGLGGIIFCKNNFEKRML
jgi:hypothetical protein